MCKLQAAAVFLAGARFVAVPVPHPPNTAERACLTSEDELVVYLVHDRLLRVLLPWSLVLRVKLQKVRDLHWPYIRIGGKVHLDLNIKLTPANLRDLKGWLFQYSACTGDVTAEHRVRGKECSPPMLLLYFKRPYKAAWREKRNRELSQTVCGCARAARRYLVGLLKLGCRLNVTCLIKGVMSYWSGPRTYTHHLWEANSVSSFFPIHIATVPYTSPRLT